MKTSFAVSLVLNVCLVYVLTRREPATHAQGLAGGGGGQEGVPSQNGDANGDGKRDLSDALYILNFLFLGGPAIKEIPMEDCPVDCSECPAQPASVQLPATGQTLCFDSSGNTINCTSSSFPGQDGFYQAGCPVADRYVDNGDGTVTDTCTGLMWQNTAPPETYDWQQSLMYCDDLVLGGHSDWRLPNVRELLSIQEYGQLVPSVDPIFVESTFSDWYWSSSTAQDLPSLAWIVSFGVGIAKGWPKTAPYYARAVRDAD